MSKGPIALILAAGKGTRFKSERIKVLHPLMGKPMIQLVVDSISRLNPESIHVVVGFQKEEVMREISSTRVNFVIQKRQLGTAHAVLAAKDILKKNMGKDILIMNGDLPLIQAKTLRPFLNYHRKMRNSLTFLTSDLENPTGFGRVFHTNDNRVRIIEEKDATSVQKRIKESNVGIYLFKKKDLLSALPKISNKNKKKEYYITDIIEIMSHQKIKTAAFKIKADEEIIGINDRFELALATEILRKRKIKQLTENGVTVYDPSTAWIDLDVKIGSDTMIHSSVIIEGKSIIGSECKLYPFIHIRDSRIGNKVKVLTSTVIEESVIKDNVQVGPFSRLRPKTILQQGSKVGNFVEMKKTVFGRNSKAGHLSYIGDSTVEEEVNIGAGTITCNYDGKMKHRTKIGAGAFIGSGTELVAPVKIGKKAYIAAGSTITKNVSSNALAVSRSKQVEKPGWSRKKRKK